MERACEDCVFFQGMTGIQPSNQRRHVDGQCRRWAPSPATKSPETMYALWPFVAFDDWCGEFERSFADAEDDQP